MCALPKAPTHLYSLDALRGLAALAVVIWHWQHFYHQGILPAPSFIHTEQPLYDFLFLFYRSGFLAVDLFFSLSGFVFFWLYSDTISSGATTAKRFFVLRFSRLYPLHLISLLCVVLGQWQYLKTHGETFIYANHDWRHLFLNVFMASSIGLERGFSFNAPTWSVSVEAVLYGLFFIICRTIRINIINLGMLSAVGFLAIAPLYEPVGRGIGSFFVGGVAYLGFLKVRQSQRQDQITSALVRATTILWLASVVQSHFEFQIQSIPFVWRIAPYYPTCVLFPFTIITLALIECRSKKLGRSLAGLGNISYSSYLLHFPLQIAFVVTAPMISNSASWHNSSAVFILYFAVLITLSTASYRYVEMPLQRRIRNSWPR